jgi:hypothetical protein
LLRREEVLVLKEVLWRLEAGCGSGRRRRSKEDREGGEMGRGEEEGGGEGRASEENK